jgi:CheY-like chemotaxis protein
MEAVDRVRGTGYDLVLMDAQMPIMNGLQAAAAIRQMDDRQRASVPIVAMTAHAMREDRQRCLAAGMNAYLAKPIDAAELVTVVERHGRAPCGDEDRPANVAQGASMGSPDRPSLDLDATLERLGGSREILGQVVQMFRDDAPALAAAIRRAVEGGNLSAAALAAHNLRGSALILGAAPLVDSAQALEEAADRGDATQARGALTRLEAELARLMARLASV